MPDPVPPPAPGLHETLLRFVDVLEARDVAYMIVGAVAVGVWGRPRTTLDIDVTIRADTAGLEAIAAAAAPLEFVVDRQWLEWNPLLRGQQLRLTRGGVMVDAMRPRDSHEEMALDRRRDVVVDTRRLWFAAPDDLVLMKLKAGRPRDFEDVVGILTSQGGALDRPYLFDWARRLGVADELAYVLRETGA